MSCFCEGIHILLEQDNQLRQLSISAIVLQVPQSIVTEVASEADSKKYCTFALRSFVEDNRQLTWCPSPGQPVHC